VYLGPNNIGKTAVLEALNFLLNPELSNRGTVVDENDFYCREYRIAPPRSSVNSVMEAKDEHAQEENTAIVVDGQNKPKIRIEAVLVGIDDDDLSEFSNVLLPWNSEQKMVVETAAEGTDPFSNAEQAIRVCFEAWYDEEEDSFEWRTFFKTDTNLTIDEFPSFTRLHKRRIGFLIYRDFRALQRPITLEPATLFSRLLQSQDATPKNFEEMLTELIGSAAPLFKDENFARVVNEFKEELKRYLPLATDGNGSLSFEITDLTRSQVKAETQLYVTDRISLPIQKMGAGTRSLSTLAILLLIARKRGRGIIALEEPETFLFPHAQRRVVDEVLSVATQTFVTSHSPYVLERMPIDSFQRLHRDSTDNMKTTNVVTDIKMAKRVRERFHRQLSEALLGRAAIVVEEDSTRLWILKASSLLHGKAFAGRKMEAIELQGIGVVSTQGNGDVPAITGLLHRAGLMVLAFIDQITDAEFSQMKTKEPDVVFTMHTMKGLEELLLAELPVDLLKDILVHAPYVKKNYLSTEVDSWGQTEFEENAREFLIMNKGSLPMHEWILDKVDFKDMPATFKNLVSITMDMVSGSVIINYCTIFSKCK
jgi:putative ATP-dependent endonuclease of OLD family